MRKLKFDIYEIEVINESTYIIDSADNNFTYGFVYHDNDSLEFKSSKHGVKLYKEGELIRSAIVCASAGATDIHENSAIIDHDSMLICCANKIFSLRLPDLTLNWITQADLMTCFGIFKLQDSFIVHGEMEITKLDSNGNILWQNEGADIFTTENGIDDFEITDSYIRATDWENRTYKFSFDGRQVE